MIKTSDIIITEQTGEDGDTRVRGAILLQAEAMVSREMARSYHAGDVLREVRGRVRCAIWHRIYGHLRKPLIEFEQTAFHACGSPSGYALSEQLRKQGDALHEMIVFKNDKGEAEKPAELEVKKLTAWEAIAQVLPFIKEETFRMMLVQSAIAEHGPCPDQWGDAVRSGLGSIQWRARV